MNHDASPSAPTALPPAALDKTPGKPLKLGPIQAASGAIFALFLLLHLLTAASGALGPVRYDATLGQLRHIYRPHVVVEVFVIGASAAVHIACAVLQMVRRRKVFAVKGPLWMRAHRLAGYFLLFVILGHVLATRIAPTLAEGPTATGKADFAFLAFATLSAPLFFWPYYLLLGVAGSLHLGLGLHLASRVLRSRKSPAQGGGIGRARVAAIIGFTIIVAGGVFQILRHAGDAPRDRFPEYKALADKLLR